MTQLKTINYAFPLTGLNETVALQHAEFARERLSEHFNIDPESVRVSFKDRLPGDAPLMLTCYSGTSKTDSEAMIVAAKVVLPNLRECLSRCSAADADDWERWVPGADADADARFVAHIAAGFSHKATTGQKEWLRGFDPLTLALLLMQEPGTAKRLSP